MKSELAKKLKEVLDRKSKEEFKKDWAEIKALNLEGPHLSEVIRYFSNKNVGASFEVVASPSVSKTLTYNNYNSAA